MFGMLDYRAHKLYWLLYLPMRLAFFILFLASITLSILASIFILNNDILPRTLSIPNNFIVNLFISYVLWEMFISPVNLVIAKSITFFYNKAFFFIIDVVPCSGTSKEEATLVTTLGEKYLLSKKFETDIGHWTEEDTEKWVSISSNWRGRLIFDVKTNFRKLVEDAKNSFNRTGKQFKDVDFEGKEAIFSRYNNIMPFHMKIVNYFFVEQHGFNTLKASIIMAASFTYLASLK